MKRSGDDCNCETLTRGDVSDTGVRPNELGSRNQGIADSHDSSPTLRLSEESKNRRQNQPIISFHKRIHRLIQHHKRSQSSKQHTLWIENPFCFQEVAFIQQQTIPSLPQCQSVWHTHSTPHSDHRNEIIMESMESTTLLSRCWRIQDGQTQPISTDHRKERESQWIIPTPFSRILQAMKEWIIGWVGIWMGESKTIVFWKVKQWCWLDGVTNRREFVLRPFVCRNRFTKQSLFMDWPR